MKKKLTFVIMASLAATSCMAQGNGVSSQPVSSVDERSSASSSSDSPKLYTITWKNYNGDILKTDSGVTEGSVPEYKGATPTRPDEGGYEYSFSGWSPSVTPAYSNATYTATFAASRAAYGLYPQTHVSDAVITARLDALTTTESNGWYLLDGTYYAKETANPYGTSYTFDDGTTITEGTAYWFRCEPIKWDILSSSNGAYSLVSSALLDPHRYDSSSNNYAKSEIRSWLNGGFYDTAFSLDDSCIQTVTVGNSAATTGSSTNIYACENTNDKVYLLSYQDYGNAEYFANDAARLCKPTDWAKANGAYVSSEGYGWYWSRSPYSRNSGCAWSVYGGGDLDYDYVSVGNRCVRPSLQIKVS